MGQPMVPMVPLVGKRERTVPLVPMDVLHDAFPISFPAVFGFEGAGVVAALGANTTGRLKVGDEVWMDLGNEYIGTYADFAVSSTRTFITLLSFDL